MADAAYTPDQPFAQAAYGPTIRADKPTVVTISPDLRDALVVIVGCAIVAFVGMSLASYLMLPFAGG